MIDGKRECPLESGTSLHKTYIMKPVKGVTKNWIALEDSYTRSSSALASTVVCNAPEERNVFAIYVSYYAQVLLTIGLFREKLSVKLPFTLLPSPSDMSECFEHIPTERNGSPHQSENIDSTPMEIEMIGTDIPSSTYDKMTFREYSGRPRRMRYPLSELNLDCSEL